MINILERLITGRKTPPKPNADSKSIAKDGETPAKIFAEGTGSFEPQASVLYNEVVAKLILPADRAAARDAFNAALKNFEVKELTDITDKPAFLNAIRQVEEKAVSNYPEKDDKFAAFLEDVQSRLTKAASPLKTYRKQRITFQEKLELLDPAKIGYPGPRSRLPIPEELNIKALDKIEAQISASKPQKIIICYPTQLSYIREKTRDASTYGEEIEKIIRRCHPTAQIECMPFIKLTQGSVTGNYYLNPVRLWTNKKPEKDALYIFCDQNIDSGKTLLAAYSLLHHYGVESQNMIFKSKKLAHISGEHTNRAHIGRVKPTQTQKRITKELWKTYPETATKMEIMLDLIGIGGMSAITYQEAHKMGMVDEDKGMNIAESKKAIETQLNFLNGIYKNISPIPEVTPEFIAEVTKLGFAPEAHTSRIK